MMYRTLTTCFAADKKSVTLSNLARETHPLAENTLYTFVKPQPLPDTPASLFTFDISDDPQEPARVPLEFAKKVYGVDGFPNDKEWTIQAVYGPVSGNLGWDPSQTVAFASLSSEPQTLLPS
jgi:hypothetical protein